MDNRALSMYAQCNEPVVFLCAVFDQLMQALGLIQALSPRSGVGLSDPKLLITQWVRQIHLPRSVGTTTEWQANLRSSRLRNQVNQGLCRVVDGRNIT